MKNLKLCRALDASLLISHPHLQLMKAGGWREDCGGMLFVCVFMVYKEYHVHHISETGSSITAHSPHITPFL